LAWKIEFLPEAAKELKKLDRTAAARIVKTLEQRIAVLDAPQTWAARWWGTMRAIGAGGSGVSGGGADQG